MLIPLNWLSDFIEITDTEKINKLLLQAGLEVEEVLDYKNKDKVLKVEVTPNRGDWANIIGVSRELAALTGKELKYRPAKIKLDSKLNTEADFDVEIKAKQACRKYIAYQIQDLEVKQSTSKIKTRLDKIGEKTVNNVVDATNYSMFALGQPLHAFDADKIKGSKVIIRLAEKGEKIHLIDGKVVDLTIDDLVIADNKKAIALAGIMGGLDTQVDKNTKNILLESAWFDPKAIRATLKRHQKKNIDTEASYRFERYVDPQITNRAAKLALSIIINSNQKVKIGKPIVAKGQKFEPSKIEVDRNKINRLIGFKLSADEIEEALQAFGFKIDKGQATAPSWRSDVAIGADLAEEVARFNGYNNIPEKKLKKGKDSSQKSNWHKLQLLKDFLADKNFNEVYNYSFITPEDIKTFNLDKSQLLEVKNPVDPDNKYMRNSLYPGLIKAVAKNQQESKLAIFEIGQVFNQKSFKNKQKNLKLGLTAYKLKKSRLKQLIKNLEKNLGVPAQHRYFHRSDDKDKQIFDKYKIRKPELHIVEFSLTDANLGWLKGKINMPPQKGFSYSKVSKYPEVSRDLAFIVKENIKGERVEDFIKKLDQLIVRVELFDEFAHKKFGENKKNIAFHIFFQSPDKTLTDKEVDKLIKRIIKKAEERFSANLRKQ